MNNVTTNQNFRQRRGGNYKKNNAGGGRQDFRRGGNNGGGHSSYNTAHGNGGSGSHHARHPELDIVIDGKAAKRASTMRDKYQSMARDAHSGGDRVYAEYCNQHVEHYNRILNAFNESRPQHLRTPDAATENGDDMQAENTPQEAAQMASVPPVVAEDEPYQAAAGA